MNGQLRKALERSLFRIIFAVVLALIAGCGEEPAAPPPCIWPEDFKPIVLGQDTVWYCIKVVQ